MLIMEVIVSLSFSSSSLETLFEQITPQLAAERISECGLGEVSIRYEEDLQSEVLKAAEATSVTDEQLTCADKAASYYDLELPPAIQPRYDAIREARISAYTLLEAQAWLKQRGLLERVPTYEAGVTDDAAFTRQLEDLCGPRAKGAFQSEYGFHVLSPNWIMNNLGSFDEDQEVFACLMQVAQVAGFEISFIGNDKYSEKD